MNNQTSLVLNKCSYTIYIYIYIYISNHCHTVDSITIHNILIPYSLIPSCIYFPMHVRLYLCRRHVIWSQRSYESQIQHIYRLVNSTKIPSTLYVNRVFVSSVYISQYASKLYNIQCIVYNVHCIVYIVQCTPIIY